MRAGRSGLSIVETVADDLIRALRIVQQPMWRTCDYVRNMSSRMIQIRNVPDPIHRTLNRERPWPAFRFRDYLLREITCAQRPTFDEILEVIDADSSVHLRVPCG